MQDKHHMQRWVVRVLVLLQMPEGKLFHTHYMEQQPKIKQMSDRKIKNCYLTSKEEIVDSHSLYAQIDIKF